MTIEKMVQELIEMAKAAEARGDHAEASRLHDAQFKLIDDYYKSLNK